MISPITVTSVGPISVAGLGMEAIKSGLLSFTRVTLGCEGLSLGPDVTWLID